MAVTRVSRFPVSNCGRCKGPLFDDSLGLAPFWCLHCGERYDTALVALRRAPSTEEMAKLHSVNISESRLVT